MRGRLIFLGVVTSIFLTATWIATATWCVFTGTSSLAWHLVPQVLTLGFVAATLLGAKYEGRAIRYVYRVSAIFMSYLNFALVASVLCWIVWVAACLFHWSFDSRIFAFWIFGIAGIVTLYGLFNAGRLRVTDFTVKLPNLPDAWTQRVGVLASDVHLGNIRRFVDRLVRKISALNPDIVFVSGDMFDGCPVDLAKVTEPWSRLAVPHGVYFVSGNHDEFLDLRSQLNALERAGMRLLNGESVMIDGIAIAGVNDGESDDPEVLKRHLAQAGGHSQVSRDLRDRSANEVVKTSRSSPAFPVHGPRME